MLEKETPLRNSSKACRPRAGLDRGRIAFLAEAGNRAREPDSKSLGAGLFELRTKSSRIFYCFKPGGVIVLLHGFTKKSQKTPNRKLQMALNRMKEV
jgi:phage-related protein